MKIEKLIGKKCTQGNTLEIMSDNAGYYLGTTVEEDGIPYPNCRISVYAESSNKLEAMEYVYRDCVENNYCNKCKGCIATELFKYVAGHCNGLNIDTGNCTETVVSALIQSKIVKDVNTITEEEKNFIDRLFVSLKDYNRGRGTFDNYVGARIYDLKYSMEKEEHARRVYGVGKSIRVDVENYIRGCCKEYGTNDDEESIDTITNKVMEFIIKDKNNLTSEDEAKIDDSIWLLNELVPMVNGLAYHIVSCIGITLSAHKNGERVEREEGHALRKRWQEKYGTEITNKSGIITGHSIDPNTGEKETYAFTCGVDVPPIYTENEDGQKIYDFKATKEARANKSMNVIDQIKNALVTSPSSDKNTEIVKKEYNHKVLLDFAKSQLPPSMKSDDMSEDDIVKIIKGML